MKKSRCLHCLRTRYSKNLLNGDYCRLCTERRISDSLFPRRLVGARRCIIPNCSNHTDEGLFVGDLCSPCYSYVVLNKGIYSQAYRNELAKARLRNISRFLAFHSTKAKSLLRESLVEAPESVEAQLKDLDVIASGSLLDRCVVEACDAIRAIVNLEKSSCRS